MPALENEQTDLDNYIVPLSISLLCAVVDVGFLAGRVYVTYIGHGFEFTEEGLGYALMVMLIYGAALIMGLAMGIIAGRCGGFKAKSVSTYIGIVTPPISILLNIVANPWLL